MRIIKTLIMRVLCIDAKPAPGESPAWVPPVEGEVYNAIGEIPGVYLSDILNNKLRVVPSYILEEMPRIWGYETYRFVALQDSEEEVEEEVKKEEYAFSR